MTTADLPPQVSMETFKSKGTAFYINNWVAQRVNELLGFEDEVVIQFVVNSLDAEARGRPTLRA